MPTASVNELLLRIPEDLTKGDRPEEVAQTLATTGASRASLTVLLRPLNMAGTGGTGALTFRAELEGSNNLYEWWLIGELLSLALTATSSDPRKLGSGAGLATGGFANVRVRYSLRNTGTSTLSGQFLVTSTFGVSL